MTSQVPPYVLSALTFTCFVSVQAYQREPGVLATAGVFPDTDLVASSSTVSSEEPHLRIVV